MTVMTDTGLSSVGQIIAWTVVGNANNGGTMNIVAIYGSGLLTMQGIAQHQQGHR
jgi:hypothetical protein